MSLDLIIQVIKIDDNVDHSHGNNSDSELLKHLKSIIKVFTWNTDAWGYGASTTSLYKSHPWVLAVLLNGDALGVLADTTRRCEIDLRKESTIKFVSLSHAVEVGRGSITIRDMERMAATHDFTWTDKELSDMIHCFDSDRDGKLSLDDFRNIVQRCNMLQVQEKF